jgi:hypothetical protein
MSGTAYAVQLATEALGEAAGTVAAASLVTEALGYDTAETAAAVQLVAEAIGLHQNPARAAMIIVEVIAQPPIALSVIARERSFPLGYRNYPPRPGSFGRYGL